LKKFFCILILATAYPLFSQVLTKKISRITVDDKSEGYVLYSYKIPEDGFYTFSIDGGLLPKNDYTIYYYEYRFKLSSANRYYVQPSVNVSSQAQDGNICHFSSNEKNNKVSGNFRRDEHVQVYLEILKSDVNGTPHRKLHLTGKTVVNIEKNKPLVATN
jgi:hypothetical protein